MSGGLFLRGIHFSLRHRPIYTGKTDLLNKQSVRLIHVLPVSIREKIVPKLRGEGLVWLIGAVVCLCGAPWVQLFASAGSGWPHNAPRYH